MKVYTDYTLRGWKLLGDLTEEELKAELGHWGLTYKGKDKKGTRYYGNYKYNYVAVLKED